MKKILSIITLMLVSLLLVSCRDRKFQSKHINVSFYTSRFGFEMDPILNLEPNSLIPEPTVIPLREGYNFQGWYTDLNYTKLWDFDNDRIKDKSIILYAKWGAGFFNIDYVLNGGSYPNDFKELSEYPEDQRDPETNEELLKYLFYKVGDNKIIFTPQRTGYKFAGWYTYQEYEWPNAPEGTDIPRVPGDHGHITLPTTQAKNIVMYAHWDLLRSNVTFNLNLPPGLSLDIIRRRPFYYGYELVYDHNAVEGQTDINKLPSFVGQNTGKYEFIGWNARRNGEGVWYNEGDVFERSVDITLYAQWHEK